MSTSWVRHVENELAAQNPSVEFKWTRLAQGGGNFSQYVGWTSPFTGDWYPGSGYWVGNQTNPGYAYNAAPDAVFFEASANDYSGSANVAALVALIAMVQGWPSPPAIFVVYDVYQNTAGTGVNDEWNITWGSQLEVMCSNLGVGFIDFRRPLVMMHHGFDPNHSVLERVPPAPTRITNFNPMYYAVKGYEFAVAYIGTPLAFWTAVGNMVTMPLGSDNNYANTALQNNLSAGYDGTEAFPGAPSASPDALWIRADFGVQLPGFGLKGGTLPRLYGTYAMSIGSNLVTYTPYSGGPATAWVAGDNGKVVTVVGAGSTSTGAAANVRSMSVLPGGIAIGHLVGYFKYVSGTSCQICSDAALTTALNAVTAISGQGFGVMFGSPRVYTGITGIAAGALGMQVLRVSMRDNEVALNFGGNSKTFRRRVAQPGALRMSFTLLFNGNPNASWATNVNGQPEFFIVKLPTAGKRSLVAPSLTDDAITGAASFDNAALPLGGSGGNHPAEGVNPIYVAGLAGINLAIP